MIAKLKVIESRDMAENDACPILLRLSFGSIPVLNSPGRSEYRLRKEALPCPAPQEISHIPITTEAIIPTVAAVIARLCICSRPYCPKDCPIAAAVPCPPQNPAGIDSPSAGSALYHKENTRKPRMPPNAH